MTAKVSTSENKVLFGVINWGIGHATRSSVIIDELLAKGFRVEILSNGKALEFLRNRYQQRCVYHRAYRFNVPYNTDSLLSYLRLGVGLMCSFLYDSLKVKALTKTTQYDCIISDSRAFDFGNYSGEKILVNHQLSPQWPFLKKALQKKMDAWQNRFHSVWIPDFDGGKLSGKLSINPMVTNKRYIGTLSRLDAESFSEIASNTLLFYGFHREEVEENLQLELLKKGYTLLFANKQADVCKDLLQKSNMVISNPGYSSVMELYGINKPVLLCNRPWHAEQSTLFNHLVEQKLFCGTQSLSVQDILALSTKKPATKPFANHGKLLKLAIDCINK